MPPSSTASTEPDERSLVHDIALRVATLVVLFAAMALADWLGSAARAGLWSLVVVAVGHESWRLRSPRSAGLAGLAVGAAAWVLALSLAPHTLAILAAGAFVGSWFLPSTTRSPVRWLPVVALGAACLLVALRRPMGSLFLVFSLLQCHDIVAYLVGRLLGKRRIAPRLSPGKTFEGTASGVFALWSGIAVAHALGTSLPEQLMVLAVGLGLVALAGDLWFSRIKRRFHLSDFGAALPGHGGFTDRFDSMIFAGIPWLLAT